MIRSTWRGERRCCKGRAGGARSERMRSICGSMRRRGVVYQRRESETILWARGRLGLGMGKQLMRSVPR